MSRPEHKAPPEIFYGDSEAQKYTSNTRIQNIQSEMTHRALELLCLPEDRPSLLLDIGCGSGLSGEIISEYGHEWVGVDIAPSMLEVALEREVDGDLVWGDIGQGCFWRAGAFDGAISISVLQWLCNADASSHSPAARLATFFTTLYSSLSLGARAVFQFYPESDEQVKFIMSFAIKAGFSGGLVVDYPNSKKAKKFYLVLMVGGQGPQARKMEVPRALQEGETVGGGRLGVDDETQMDAVRFENKRRREKVRAEKAKRKGGGKDRDWILRKKELYRKKGKEVPRDSAYTGRKRKTAF